MGKVRCNAYLACVFLAFVVVRWSCGHVIISATHQTSNSCRRGLLLCGTKEAKVRKLFAKSLTKGVDK